MIIKFKLFEQKEKNFFKIIDIYNNNSNKEDFINELKELFMGKNISVMEYIEGDWYEEPYGGGYMTVDDIVWDDGIGPDKSTSYADKGEKFEKNISMGFVAVFNNKIRITLSDGIKIIKSLDIKEDPYGEEDWEDELIERRINEDIDTGEIDPYGEENWGGPEELEIEIVTQKIAEDKQDSFWYFDKTIAVLRKEDISIEIVAVGDITLNFEDNGDNYYNQDAVDYANSKGLTDEDLEEIRGTTGFINNNWFEFWVNGDAPGDFGGDVAYEYDEAINTAKAMIEE
jgi:hypothetical protein